MKKLIPILLLLLCGCTAQQRINRKHRQMERIARTYGLTMTDTIIVRDTVITERIQKDTIFKESTFYQALHDTIVINHDRLTIKEYYHNNTDSIVIWGECAPDTIPVEIPVIVEKPVVVTKEKSSPWWMWLLIGGSLLIAVVAMLRRR